nr:MAG TPA: hypothetical protein [Caudoviricetes sp.]
MAFSRWKTGMAGNKNRETTKKLSPCRNSGRVR